MGTQRKVSAVLTVAVALGACVAVAGPATADGCGTWPGVSIRVVPGSHKIPFSGVVATPTCYSRPNELQVCMTGAGPYCTWPK
ncbi:hypothetical protein ABZX92_28755 [Lentzea sp. NPDC006480]|uniref:hypothetical protein n=1 Tax=Lentzea sp. NPDC006480 TaxID=3157176 RepID=UPI0033A5D4AD